MTRSEHRRLAISHRVDAARELMRGIAMVEQLVALKLQLANDFSTTTTEDSEDRKNGKAQAHSWGP